MFDTSELLRLLLDRTGDSVILLDRAGKIVSANRASAEILGYSQSGLVGLPFGSLVLSEELALVESDHARLWAEEALPARTRRFTRRDGTIVTALVDECLVEGQPGAGRCILTILRDQTGQRAITAALHDSRQQLRGILEHSEDGIYLKDPDGNYLTINPAGARMFGRPAIDIMFRDDRYLFPEQEANEIRELDRLAIESGEPHSSESFRTIAGAVRSFATTRLPFRDAGGEVAGLLGITRDVTERRELEDRFDELDRRYRSLIDANADGVVMIDPLGAILELSPQAEARLGFHAKALAGSKFADLIPVYRRGPHQEAIDALLAGSRSEHYACSLTRANGRILPVEIHAGVLLDANGQPARIQILFRDLSERLRDSQERSSLLESLRERTGQIQAAFEISSSIALTLDLANLLGQSVEILKQRFGYHFVGVFLVDGDEAVLAAGSGEDGKSLLEKGLRLPVQPDSIIGWTITNRRMRQLPEPGADPDQPGVPMLPEMRSELAIPLIAQGDPIGALSVQSKFPDAFSREEAAVLQIMAEQLAVAVQNARLHQRLADYAGDLEKRVQERTAQLETVNRDLEAFSYSISHDLRAPLRAVRGYAGILFDRHAPELSPDASAYLAKIDASASRMGQLIEDLLDFARLGRRRVQKKRVEPVELIDDVLEAHAAEIERRGVAIRVGPLSAVSADRSLLRQVFANLVSNAVKFTRGSAEPAIEIGERPTVRGLAIFVKDNGAGFDPDQGQKLFEVFHRLHGEDEFEGSGVGLAIVQRIIRRHGGEVWFEAAPGEGATFFFCLPTI